MTPEDKVAAGLCPGIDCDEEVPLGMLGCRHHWFMLPVQLRREINAAWGERRRHPSSAVARERHEQAKVAAFAWWERNPGRVPS